MVEGCSALGIILSEEKRSRFASYLGEILVWNRRMNLVSRREVNSISLHHFLDSVSPLSHVPMPRGAELIDVGPGAGFPGLPLKICRPDLRLTLVESTRKKALFLRHISEKLGLSEVTILCQRAERLNREGPFQNRYDVAVARAVARLRFLVCLCLPFLRTGGRFVAFKGGDIEEELEEALPELPSLSGRLERSVEIVLPISSKKRKLLVFTKG